MQSFELQCFSQADGGGVAASERETLTKPLPGGLEPVELAVADRLAPAPPDAELEMVAVSTISSMIGPSDDEVRDPPRRPDGNDSCSASITRSNTSFGCVCVRQLRVMQSDAPSDRCRGVPEEQDRP